AGSLVRLRLDAAQHRAGWEAERRQLLCVVDAAGDDRLIRITLEEGDDDFLRDARRRDRAPALAGPGMRDANPARAVLVLLAAAIPVELHLHAAVLVGVDLVTRRADDDRGLRTLHEWFWRLALRAELLRAGHDGKRAPEARFSG